MFLHLPFVDNRIDQFSARFEPHGDGFVYHGDRVTGGLPVTSEERDRFIAAYASTIHRSLSFALLASVLCAIAVAVLGLSGVRFFEHSNTIIAVLAVIGASTISWFWYTAAEAPMAEIGQRFPLTAPRSAAREVQSRMAAIPTRVPIILLVLCVVLIVQTIRLGQSIEHLLFMPLGVSGIAVSLLILKLKKSRQTR